MHVTYAFVYYFSIFIMMLTAGLSIFVVRKIRKSFFAFANRNNLSRNPILTLIFYIVFALIFIILIDAVMTYISIKDQLADGNSSEFILRLQKYGFRSIRGDKERAKRGLSDHVQKI